MTRAIEDYLAPVGELDRKTYIGGSDAAAVMGLGAYGKTPYTVWLSKTGQAIEDIDPERERFFARRKRFEPLIVEMLREEFSAEIIGVNQRYTNSNLPGYFASEIDFEWIDPETGLIENGEIKTVSPFAYGVKQGWGEAGTDEVPIQYAAQAVHGLGVTGRRKTIIAALVGFDNMTFYQINRDEDLIKDMQARCRTFWEENVLKRIEPEPIVLDDLKSMLLMRPGRPVELDDKCVQILRDIETARLEKKLIEDEAVPELEFQLLSYLRTQWGLQEDETIIDNAIMTRGGRPVATWKRQGGAYLDQKKLKNEHPDLVDKYTKRTLFRVLRMVKPK